MMKTVALVIAFVVTTGLFFLASAVAEKSQETQERFSKMEETIRFQSLKLDQARDIMNDVHDNCTDKDGGMYFITTKGCRDTWKQFQVDRYSWNEDVYCKGHC